MADYQNRPLSPDDLDVISGLPRHAGELFYMYPKGVYPLTPEQIRETLKTRFCPTVITAEGGEIAAYANLYDCVRGAECWLGNVIVAPGYRGKGASSYLIRTMMDKAKREFHAPYLNLICHNTNTPALLLYTKLGFRLYDVSEKTGPDGERLAGIHMRVSL
ncbi:GNAT family N-acetyltransferase [Paenibacillus sp. UNC499MF]|uniref:GNAT family N-acetyltransferase n=1 Tax=Paenibacillus sp. UNC499MF TaxID=1502751 RepID=UPI00089FDF2A|nr:GNAT family N-acetyltransferase [Paenibacillus sp. UNC499MF]SEG73067.1 Ribosomal protein S18 acetylase RimI [Paenibacillus sp. UNC499MF]